MKTTCSAIAQITITTLALVFGVFLAVCLLSPYAAAQTDFCAGGILDQGAPLGQPAPDLVIFNMGCTVDGTKGPYNFHNVYIFGTGSKTGTLSFSDATMDFYAANILVQYNGVLQATGIGVDNDGKVLTIHLYGSLGDPGVTCKKMSNGAVVDDTQCGVPSTIWDSNTELVMKSMRYPNNFPATPCNKAILPGGVNDCFYQYDVFDKNDAPGAYFGHKVIALSYGGTIEMSGYKGAQGGDDSNPAVTGSSWMRLNGTLKGGEDSLTVTGVPADWQPNDNIVVTATDYLPGHAEQLQVATVSGSTVNLMSAVKNPHWGQTYSLDNVPAGIGPDKDPNVTCSGDQKNCVDRRAAVGLLSRSIRIVSDGATAHSSLPGYYGGHTVMRQGFLSYQVQGVEFYQLGQGGAIGHYPVHFHMARQTPANTYVKDSSMWDSMTRWVTIHATQGVTLARNVGYKSIGHGFYLEDGTEAYNVLNTNLGVFARAAVQNAQNDRNVPGILAEPADFGGPNPYHSDWQSPAVFWIMNSWNDFQYNFASSAGTCGVCYWQLPGGISTLSQYEFWEGYAGQQFVKPWMSQPGFQENQAGYTPLKKFVGNSCSTAMMGFLNVGDAAPCNGVSNDGNAAELQAVPNSAAPPQGPQGMDNYYPYVTGKRNPTICVPDANNNCANATAPNLPCQGTPDVYEANCAETTLEHFATSFNWAEKNFSAVWLRNWWFLVENSAITDVQQGGITFVTGGGYTRADVAKGYWALLRKSALVGNTQSPDGEPDNPFASSGGPFNPNGLQCSPGPPTAAYCLSKDQGISYPSDTFTINQRMLNIYDGPSYQEENAFLDIPITKMGQRTPATCPAPTMTSNYQLCDFGYLSALQFGVPADPSDPSGSPECYLPNAAIAWKQSNGFFYPPAFHSQNLFYDNVGIRHFVIEPLFSPQDSPSGPYFQTNQTAVAQRYCTFSGGYNGLGSQFGSYTDIDRQTVLNDDDGSLTGLLSSQLGSDGKPRETISVNQDPFFNAPVTTPECASDIHDGNYPDIGLPATADTSPYEYVTTATIAACAIGPSGCPQPGPPAWNAWAADAGDSSCYGVPLYRQYLTAAEYKQYIDKDPNFHLPYIRMMGQGTGQRGTLTVNHGKYYIDDQPGRQTQMTAGATNLNVYLPGQVYYTYFVYAKPSLDQTYQMWVGTGLDRATVIASVQPYRANLTAQAYVFNPASGAKFLDVDYDDPTKGVPPGVVQIRVHLDQYQTEFDDDRITFCKPASYCTAQGTGKNAQCVCNTANPECKSGDSSVCSWAIKDIDCPTNGCFAFGITMPQTFKTDVARPPAPGQFTDDPNYATDWNVPFDWQGIDAGAQCMYASPPQHKVARTLF